MIERLATYCHRRRRIVMFAWVVIVLGVTVLAGAFGGNDVDGGRLNGTDSDTADQLASHEFPSGAKDLTVVFHAADGVSGHRAAIDGYVSGLGSIPGVNPVMSPFEQRDQVSADGTTAFVRIDIDTGHATGGAKTDRDTTDRDTTVGARADPTAVLRERSADLQPQGVQVEFLGDGLNNEGPPASELFACSQRSSSSWSRSGRWWRWVCRS